uniref:Uncharacterized protein n=1 Tax=Leersia perrieri TaxID=77586 RepID=A0A0D9WQ29_9ORYZ
MVFDMKDEEMTTKERLEMEDLCSRLASLIPQDYSPVDATSQDYNQEITRLESAFVMYSIQNSFFS